MTDELGRRALLRCGAACAAAAACGKFVDEPLAIEVGAPSKNLLSVPMARLPELARPGGSVLLHVDAADVLGRRVSILVANTTSQTWSSSLRQGSPTPSFSTSTPAMYMFPESTGMFRQGPPRPAWFARPAATR